MKALRIWPLVLLFLTACSAPTAAPQVTHSAAAEQPTAAALQSGRGGLLACVPAAPETWEEGEIFAFAAAFYSSSDSSGFYMLDPGRDPRAALDTQGCFQFNDLPPHEYVLVIGPRPEQGRLVAGEDDRPRIFNVTAGETLQPGELSLLP